jgi:hypothetical protein
MTYAKMLASVMAAVGIAAGYTYTAETLDDAGEKLVAYYETEVLAQYADLDDLLASIGTGR